MVFLARNVILPSILATVCPTAGFCEKPPIDTGIYGNWPAVATPLISDDGNYAAYTIENLPAGGETAVILSTDGHWKKEFAHESVVFLNSRLAVSNGASTLSIVGLGTNNIEVIKDVQAYRTWNGKAEQWLAYLSSTTRSLIVRSLISGRKYSFPEAHNYIFSQDGKVLLLQTTAVKAMEKEGKEKGDEPTELSWVDLRTGASKSIWRGMNPYDLTFDKNAERAAFISEQGSRLWIYRTDTARTEEIADEHTPGIDGRLLISEVHFSNDGTRIFLRLKEKEQKPNADAVPLNVWNYKDTASQTQQLEHVGEDCDCNMAIWIADHKTVTLTSADSGRFDQGNDDWASDERNVDLPGQTTHYDGYLISTRDGGRRKIKQSGIISPGGHYFVYVDWKEYLDPKKLRLISYSTATGIERNMLEGVSTDWNVLEPMAGGYPRGYTGVVAWMANDSAALVYDEDDIWKVDPEGREPAVNLTNGYGRKNHIMFSVIRENYKDSPIYEGQQLILIAFNTETKENGFYRTTVGRKADPELLTMGPYAYSLSNTRFANFEPIKARDTNVYLVQRQSATESRNYFITKDFKQFRRISDVHPEKDLKWYVTELHEWRMPGGKTSQGILYKPEGFDPKKQYPVLFYYYTALSDNLHVYLPPEPSNGTLNIPWYVSNGYLVFTPDIHYRWGEPMQSAYDSVVSAAEYISKMPYVNAGKMGIQGHSWGGIQTNFLVTRTHLFAAASSASSDSDFISDYNGYSHGGLSTQDGYEGGSHGPGSLWENKSWYVTNSPVMSADQVTTPFLMFETTHDVACPFWNALEFYSALRRLGKKVWLLEYEDGNHVVQGKSALDFDLRMRQFFNHYLKDAPPPKWMTEGVPARLKGVETGLDLDTSGRIP